MRSHPKQPIRGLNDGIDHTVWKAIFDRKIGPNVVFGKLTRGQGQGRTGEQDHEDQIALHRCLGAHHHAYPYYLFQALSTGRVVTAQFFSQSMALGVEKKMLDPGTLQ